MTITEIKTEIHEDIEKIKDANHLEALRLFIYSNFLNGEPVFNEEQERRLDISRKQARNGEFISNEDVDKEIDEWLEK
jgi:hypothetical protein